MGEEWREAISGGVFDGPLEEVFLAEVQQHRRGVVAEVARGAYLLYDLYCDDADMAIRLLQQELDGVLVNRGEGLELSKVRGGFLISSPGPSEQCYLVGALARAGEVFRVRAKTPFLAARHFHDVEAVLPCR